MITQDDLILMISHSGETEEVCRLLPSLKYFGNSIIGIVGVGGSTLGRSADVVLRVSTSSGRSAQTTWHRPRRPSRPWRSATRWRSA